MTSPLSPLWHLFFPRKQNLGSPASPAGNGLSAFLIAEGLEVPRLLPWELAQDLGTGTGGAPPSPNSLHVGSHCSSTSFLEMICAESCHEATAGLIYEPGAQRSTGVVCKPVWIFPRSSKIQVKDVTHFTSEKEDAVL